MEFKIAPSEFWRMKPRHFWALAETTREASAKPKIPKDEAAKIRDMLNGNDNGGFW